MGTVSPHYQHARLQALYVLQQDVGGFPIGPDVVQLLRSPVSFQEIARGLSKRPSVPVSPVHTQHVNGTFWRALPLANELRMERIESKRQDRIDSQQEHAFHPIGFSVNGD